MEKSWFPIHLQSGLVKPWPLRKKEKLGVGKLGGCFLTINPLFPILKLTESLTKK